MKSMKLLVEIFVFFSLVVMKRIFIVRCGEVFFVMVVGREKFGIDVRMVRFIWNCF